MTSFSFVFCRAVPARLSRCPPPRPASTVTPKSTWSPLTFSPARNSKISVHPHTTWRCQTSSVGTSKWVKIISLQSNSDLSEALAQGLLFAAVRRSQQESTVASCSSASPTMNSCQQEKHAILFSCRFQYTACRLPKFPPTHSQCKVHACSCLRSTWILLYKMCI